MLRVVWKLLDKPAIWRFMQSTTGFFTVRAYRRLLMDHLALTGDEVVLDVGCGTGEYANLLNCRRYIGIDFNEEYIQRAKVANGSNAKASFLHGDVAGVPRLGLKPDCLFCVGVCHHLSDTELKKMVIDGLAAGKRFVIVDLLLPSPWKNPLSYVMIRCDRGRYGRRKEKLVAALNEVGAKIERISFRMGFPHLVVGISITRAASALN